MLLTNLASYDDGRAVEKFMVMGGKRFTIPVNPGATDFAPRLRLANLALASGDARRALTVLEAAAMHVGEGGRIDEHEVREALQLRFQRADKSGEEHYNMLSAYHKSLRGSDPQGAL